jgi:hypothetical protein
VRPTVVGARGHFVRDAVSGGGGYMKLLVEVLVSLCISGVADGITAADFLGEIKKTGIEIVEVDRVIAWTGPLGAR